MSLNVTSVRFSWQTPKNTVLYVVHALSLLGLRMVKWNMCASVIKQGFDSSFTLKMSSAEATFNILISEFSSNALYHQLWQTERPWKDLERCRQSFCYLRCSIIEISPLSRSGPFKTKAPFMAEGVDPCSPASFSFLSRSLLKLTDTTRLGRVTSGAGLNPSSEDSLRLIDAARWNLSWISMLTRRRVSLNSAETFAVHSAACARISPTCNDTKI